MKPTQTPHKPQVKARRLEIRPEDLKRVQQARERAESVKVDDEWKMVAEFGYYFGYTGISAILNDDIDLEVAQKLLAGARKVHFSHVVDASIATQVAVASTKSKHPSSVMQKGLKNFIKEAQ